MSTDWADEKARKLLPCGLTCGAEFGNEHHWSCPSVRRRAVAEALREARRQGRQDIADERERADRADREVARLRAALAEIVADASCSAYIAQIAEGALVSPAPTTEKP